MTLSVVEKASYTWPTSAPLRSPERSQREPCRRSTTSRRVRTVGGLGAMTTVSWHSPQIGTTMEKCASSASKLLGRMEAKVPRRPRSSTSVTRRTEGVPMTLWMDPRRFGKT
ncbi:hypothetical protein LINPERHAP1_LOCUS19989 [Linum perenne]